MTPANRSVKTSNDATCYTRVCAPMCWNAHYPLDMKNLSFGLISRVTLSWPFLWGKILFCMQAMSCGYFIISIKSIRKRCFLSVFVHNKCGNHNSEAIVIWSHTTKEEKKANHAKLLRFLDDAENNKWCAIRQQYLHDSFFLLFTAQNSCQLSNEIRIYKPCIEWIICTRRNAQRQYVTWE